MNFFGVDVHHESFVLVAIDEKLNIIETITLKIDEFINYIDIYSPKVVAIDAPYKLNLGLMNNKDYRQKLGIHNEGHYNKKVSEYELSRRGINPFSTPDSIEKIREKTYLQWMESGFELYRILELKGYNILNELNFYRNKDKGLIEVFPHACFTILAGKLLENKKTKQGIEERIKILKEIGFVCIDNYLSSIKRKYIDDYMDAIIAAYTAFIIYNENGMFLGDLEEGQIAIPANKIQDSYKKSKVTGKENNSNMNKIEDLKKEYVYKLKNCDSVLWLKHFQPINDTTINIKNLLELINPKYIKAEIINIDNYSVFIELIKMKNRNDGLKIADKYKEVMKGFWGSMGDGNDYIIKIRFDFE